MRTPREFLVPPSPRSYLTPGETLLLVTHRHWIEPLVKILRGLAIMTALGVLASLIPMWLTFVAFIAGSLYHTGFMAWCILVWRLERVFLTNERIIRVHGVLNLNVDVAPMKQITDAVLRRNLLGRLLNYGSIRIETAGQIQGITQIDYLPNSQVIYRDIMNQAILNGEKIYS